MSGRVGHMDWDACYKCEHYPPDKGGCNVMSSGLEQFRLVYDSIECTKFKAMKK